MDLRRLFDLEPHGPDTFVGMGLEYPWGGLYGGHIVAQALRAAAETVDDSFFPHSLRAYFIRRGEYTEPVRYEVDRLRNGRSFVTRRVVARQAVGAILNLEASFQTDEDAEDVESVGFPEGISRPEAVADDSWSPIFDRRWVDPATVPADGRIGSGRSVCWLRILDDFGDDRLMQCCAFAYLSDDLPTDAVQRSVPWVRQPDYVGVGASLDHTIWFHRPMRADRWHLHDFTCLSYVGNRGLALGHIFDEAGHQVATVAQEVLFRRPRTPEP